MSDGAPKPKTEALPQGGKPTAEMTAAPKPSVSKTLTDDGGAQAELADAPWLKGGKTMPGEPPLMDVAFPPPQRPMPPMAPQPQPMMAPGMAPGIALPPPPPPAMRKRGGSGLLIGSLVGLLALLGGIIAVVLIVQSRDSSDEAPPQSLDLPAGATTEVKPEATVE